jgi:hypothetical protein
MSTRSTNTRSHPTRLMRSAIAIESPHRSHSWSTGSTGTSRLKRHSARLMRNRGEPFIFQCHSASRSRRHAVWRRLLSLLLLLLRDRETHGWGHPRPYNMRGMLLHRRSRHASLWSRRNVGRRWAEVRMDAIHVQVVHPRGVHVVVDAL